MKEQKIVICFGESLWDELPDGRRAGGAPMNVAYHLKRLGRHPLPLTAVGADAAGDRLLEIYRQWGLDITAISRHGDLPTGLVTVSLDATGAPRYHIEVPSAWDRITITPAVRTAAPGCSAVVFGTLAQRSRSNQESLAELRMLCSNAIAIFDLNFRESFRDRSTVYALARGCTLLKLSGEELALMSDDSCRRESIEKQTRELSRTSGVRSVCVTLGEEGAGLLHDDQWLRVPAVPVEVIDTVGAGDAFLAALIDGLLSPDFEPMTTLRRAAALAAYVVGNSGATPDYQPDTLGTN